MKNKGYENKPRGKTLMNRLYNLQHAKTARGLKVNGDPNSTNKARKRARNNSSQPNKKNAPRPAKVLVRQHYRRHNAPTILGCVEEPIAPPRERELLKPQEAS